MKRRGGGDIACLGDMKYVVTKKYGGQCTYNVTLRSVKAISITQCECVPSALVIQRTMRMRHISPLYDTFPHLSQKRHRFRKKKLLNTKCVLISSSFLSERFLILRRIERDVIEYVWAGADKSLARPGRKQAIATKLWIYSTCSLRSSVHLLARCSKLQATKKNSEGFPSNQVSAATVTSASDEKWLPFNCSFSPGNRW